MLYEYRVYVTETIVRPLYIVADSADEARRIAADYYNQSEISEVKYEIDPVPLPYINEEE
jgi:hypothetical protein